MQGGDLICVGVTKNCFLFKHIWCRSDSQMFTSRNIWIIFFSSYSIKMQLLNFCRSNSHLQFSLVRLVYPLIIFVIFHSFLFFFNWQGRSFGKRGKVSQSLSVECQSQVNYQKMHALSLFNWNQWICWPSFSKSSCWFFENRAHFWWYRDDSLKG